MSKFNRERLELCIKTNEVTLELKSLPESVKLDAQENIESCQIILRMMDLCGVDELSSKDLKELSDAASVIQKVSDKYPKLKQKV